MVYAIAGAAIAMAAVVIAARAREKPGAPTLALAGAPAALSEPPHDFAFNNGAVGVDLMRDGRGAAYVMADERGGFGIDLTRRPLDPLQSRGHFFYLSEEGEAPWSIGWAPARRAGDYRVEQVGFNRLVIANTYRGVRASMEVAPDAEGAVVSWRIRLEDLSGRARRLRLTSFCEIAGHQTGAYARDLDFAGMHVETIFVGALNAILARNRLLRSARADRGETSFFAVKPGAGVDAHRLRGFAHALPRRRIARQAHGLRAVSTAKTRRRGQAVDLRSRRELHPRRRAGGRGPRRSRVRRRALR